MALDCLAAGLHVLVEKPFALRLDQAQAMVGTARNAGLKLGAAYQYRTYPGPATLKKLVDEGAIGRPLRILWSFFSCRPSVFFNGWRGSLAESGGGAFVHQVVQGRPADVTAVLGTQLHGGESEDCGTVVLRFRRPAGIELCWTGFSGPSSRTRSPSCRLRTGC